MIHLSKIDLIKNEREKFTIREFIKQYDLSDEKFSVNSEGHVTVLHLSSKNLDKIPEIIRNLNKLQVLNLSHNNLKHIEYLDDLMQLKSLNIHSNKIEKINGLSNLINLKNLNLLGNKITSISGLEKLKSLENLNLALNPLLDKEKEIYEKGLAAIFEYLKNN